MPGDDLVQGVGSAGYRARLVVDYPALAIVFEGTVEPERPDGAVDYARDGVFGDRFGTAFQYPAARLVFEYVHELARGFGSAMVDVRLRKPGACQLRRPGRFPGFDPVAGTGGQWGIAEIAEGGVYEVAEHDFPAAGDRVRLQALCGGGIGGAFDLWFEAQGLPGRGLPNEVAGEAAIDRSRGRRVRLRGEASTGREAAWGQSRFRSDRLAGRSPGRTAVSVSVRRALVQPT